MRTLSLLLLGCGLAVGLGESRDVSVDKDQAIRSPQELQDRSLASEIWDDIKDATSCAGCKAVLVALKGLAGLGDSIFVDTLQDICTVSGVEDADVCDGSISREGPVIAHDIRTMSLTSDTSDEFCITFFGLCQYPAVHDWAVPFPSSKPAGGRPKPSGKTPIKVVHFSDIHVDPLYETGANANCTKPICCRPYDTRDEPGHNNDPAGAYGNHNCDAPTSLEESMYQSIESMVPDAALYLFTGDIPDHAVWNTTEATNKQKIGNAYDFMAKYLGIVYGTAGNHEASPTNLFQPNVLGDASQWVYDTLTQQWSQWIGTNATVQADKYGAYSAKFPLGNLRVISLDMNFYYRGNYYMYSDPMLKDPDGQIVWLVSELQAAEEAGENVYIIGHEPLGDAGTFHDYSNYLDQVINRYSASIAAMFFGHTHLDQFELTYSDYSHQTYQTAAAMSYIMPSLTPTSGMPSFRVYEVDPDTFGILDSITYMANMSDPDYQITGPVWTKYYSAKEVYGPLVEPPLTAADAELTPAFWHNVTQAFEDSEDDFDGYFARKSRGWNVQTCTGSCRTTEICQLRAARSQNNCYTPQAGLHFRKRIEEPAQERDECGISVSRATLYSLLVNRELVEILKRRYYDGIAAG